jgi:hypothetical protein
MSARFAEANPSRASVNAPKSFAARNRRLQKTKSAPARQLERSANAHRLRDRCEKINGAQRQQILVLVLELVVELLPKRDEPIQVHQFHVDM